MKRRDYLVTYDICDDRRLKAVFKVMRGYGDHIQYSVFRCALTRMEKIELVAKLSRIIYHPLDQVLIFQLGPLPERRPRVQPVGRPYEVDAVGRVF